MREANNKYYVICNHCNTEFSYLTKSYAVKHDKIKGFCSDCEAKHSTKPSINEKKERKKYDREVRRLTQETINENRVRLFGARQRSLRGFNIDHILSVKQGYINSIPPHKMASIENLQVLSNQENTKKGSILTPEGRRILIKFLTEDT